MKTLLSIFAALILGGFANAQWVEVEAPPSTFRTDHSFGFSADGIGYLLTGTKNAGPTADFYSFDPVAETWTQLPDFPGGTRGYGIGDFMDGKAYFGFGTGLSPNSGPGYKDDLWEYDPATGEWTELASCPCEARRHPAFVALNGKIFVGLGNGATSNLNDWWEYDRASNQWSQKDNLPSSPRHHPYMFAIDGDVYAGFGHGSVSPFIYRDWYKFDTTSESWEEVANIPGEARVAGTQFSHNGFGYILSGDGDDHSSMETGEFYKYDAATDEWEELPAHPGMSRWAPASFVIDDEVYLFNGTSTNNYIYQTTAYKYNLGPDTSVELIASQEENIKVFPNPFNNELTVVLSDNNQTNGATFTVQVRNLIGETVANIRVENNTSKLSLDHLKSGFYSIEVFNGQKRIAAKKVVKQ